MLQGRTPLSASSCLLSLPPCFLGSFPRPRAWQSQGLCLVISCGLPNLQPVDAEGGCPADLTARCYLTLSLCMFLLHHFAFCFLPFCFLERILTYIQLSEWTVGICGNFPWDVSALYMVCVQKFSETIGMCTSEFCWAVGGKIELDASAGSSKGQGCLGSHIFLWGWQQLVLLVSGLWSQLTELKVHASLRCLIPCI